MNIEKILKELNNMAESITRTRDTCNEVLNQIIALKIQIDQIDNPTKVVNQATDQIQLELCYRQAIAGNYLYQFSIKVNTKGKDHYCILRGFGKKWHGVIPGRETNWRQHISISCDASGLPRGQMAKYFTEFHEVQVAS